MNGSSHHRSNAIGATPPVVYQKVSKAGGEGQMTMMYGKDLTTPELSSSSFDMTDSGTFLAASREILEGMETHGAVSSTQCLQIMEKHATFVQNVQVHFPGALSSSVVLKKLLQTLERHGFPQDDNDDNHHTMSQHLRFAHSTCFSAPHSKASGDVCRLLTRHFCHNKDTGAETQKPFALGGYAGIPFHAKALPRFCKSAAGASSFVLLAPHVGVDGQGRVGRYNVQQSPSPQAFPSTASVVTAATSSTADSSDEPHAFSQPTAATATTSIRLCAGSTAFSFYTTSNRRTKESLDKEELYVVNQLAKVKDAIFAQPTKSHQQASLVSHVHQVGQTMLNKDGLAALELAATNKGNSRVFVLSGITINMPGPYLEDYFQPLCFFIIDKNGGVTDAFEETFGGPASRQDLYPAAKTKTGFLGLFN